MAQAGAEEADGEERLVRCQPPGVVRVVRLQLDNLVSGTVEPVAEAGPEAVVGADYADPEAAGAQEGVPVGSDRPAWK